MALSDSHEQSIRFHGEKKRTDKKSKKTLTTVHEFDQEVNDLFTLLNLLLDTLNPDELLPKITDILETNLDIFPQHSNFGWNTISNRIESNGNTGSDSPHGQDQSKLVDVGQRFNRPNITMIANKICYLFKNLNLNSLNSLYSLNRLNDHLNTQTINRSDETKNVQISTIQFPNKSNSGPSETESPTSSNTKNPQTQANQPELKTELNLVDDQNKANIFEKKKSIAELIEKFSRLPDTTTRTVNVSAKQNHQKNEQSQTTSGNSIRKKPQLNQTMVSSKSKTDKKFKDQSCALSQPNLLDAFKKPSHESFVFLGPLHDAIKLNVPFDKWDRFLLEVWLKKYLCLPEDLLKKILSHVEYGYDFLRLDKKRIKTEMKIKNFFVIRKLLMHARYIIKSFIQQESESKRLNYCKRFMNHYWLTDTWLSHLGLSKYSTFFSENLIDGLVLHSLTESEIAKKLKINDKYHIDSLMRNGILMEKFDFDVQLFAYSKENNIKFDNCSKTFSIRNIVMLSNYHIFKIFKDDPNLTYIAEDIIESGINGAMFVGSLKKDTEMLCRVLPISKNDQIARKQLMNLVNVMYESVVPVSCSDSDISSPESSKCKFDQLNFQSSAITTDINHMI